MKLIPNLGPGMRLAYVVAGGVLLIAGFIAPFSSRVLAVVVGALGAITIVEGAIGF